MLKFISRCLALKSKWVPHKTVKASKSLLVEVEGDQEAEERLSSALVLQTGIPQELKRDI